MKKIGYHYTSWNCWQEIQKDKEIKRYPICNQYCDGIWIWMHRFEGLSHTGSVIFQMSHKADTKAVLLEITYDDNFILRKKKLPIIIYHRGHIENLYYHNGTEKAVIYLRNIRIKDIRLLNVYDITKIF